MRAQRSIQVVYLISHSAICALESCLACMYQPPKMSFGSILITPTDIFCMDINVYDSPVSNLICIHIRLPSFTAAMDAGGLHTSSAPTGELPSQGWNERALNSSLGDQTLTSLTAPDLNTTPPLNSVAINHNNTTNPNNTTTSTTSARRTLLFEDDDEGLQGLMDDPPPEGDQPETKDPKKYTDEEMEPFATMDLESLRAAANHYAVRRRMTHNIRDEVDDLYYNFECSLVRLAIQYRIKPHLFSHHLGHSHRINGGTSWNNFQKYDPEARMLFDTLDRDEARNQVGALWDTKPDEEKKRYRDPAFLKTLRPMTTDRAPSDDPQDHGGLHPAPNPMGDARLNAPVQGSRVTYEKTEKMVNDWVQRVKIDMASMAFYHQVEGFFVLASLHPKSPIFKQGGSSFGNRFLQMVTSKEKKEAPALFHTWVASQAIQIENGCQPTEIKRQRTKAVGDISDQFLKGTVSDNIHEIRIQLKELIRISSGNKLSAPWPGEDCENKLRAMKLSLEIDENHWNLKPIDIMVPLQTLKHGLDRTVLTCLGLNKIHLTYHPDWDTPPRAIKKPDKRKHSSKRTPKHNQSTRPGPNASRRPAAVPNTSNSSAADCPAAPPNTSNSATDRPAAGPNTSNSATPNTSNSATDRPAAAPNTSNSAMDRPAAGPNTSNSTGPKKRKRPAPNAGNPDDSGRAAADPNAGNLNASSRAAAAPNAGSWDSSRRAAAARKSRDAHFLKQAAVPPNARNSSNNNTHVSDPPNVEGNTSSRLVADPVLDPLLEALGVGVAYT
ncbi:hypothetical protein PSHT_04050 [Puccinia striiformis]|uniref:Uncharacterized protein n=1 Tax=Puccinia striiformis TaxID=27350 RepID=A0A2S4WDT0_9BASI|nr:hypothetical protein PSHT_04050 [Puccinia striiformis]